MKFFFSRLFVLVVCFAATRCDTYDSCEVDNYKCIKDEDVRWAFKKAKMQYETMWKNVNNDPPENQKAYVWRQNVQSVQDNHTHEMEKKQIVFEYATKLLAKKCNLTCEQIAHCLPNYDLRRALKDGTLEECLATITVSCDDDYANDKYRTADGSCNNKDFPTWGMASSCYISLTDPSYADGISKMRKSVTGSDLPSAFSVSKCIHTDVNKPSHKLSHMFMQHGQYIAHDTAWTPASQDPYNKPLNCCPVRKNAPDQCSPILIDCKDKFYYGEHHTTCLDNARAAICATCTLGPRANTNRISAFVDLSQTYGYDKEVSDSLRTGKGGYLKYQKVNGKMLLPKSYDPEGDACSYQFDKRTPCFQGGDPRVNQHVSLTCMQIFFLRFHNYLAKRFAEMNRQWGDEKLYQESRRLVIACWQYLTYKEYLPIVIGRDAMEFYKLYPLSSGYTKYDHKLHPQTTKEYDIAFRFGHSMIYQFFAKSSSKENSTKPLEDLYFWSGVLYEKDACEAYIKGLTYLPSQKNDRYMIKGVTEHLYQESGKDNYGANLAATNIMRSRDTGVAPYVTLVKLCGGPEIKCFKDMDPLVGTRNRKLLQKTYKSPCDVGFFPAMLLEKHVEGGVVGPTSACIIGNQFYRWKDGDRYYFEHGDQAGSFTPEQLQVIRNLTLTKVYCIVLKYDYMPKYPLYQVSESNPVVKCSTFSGINLKPWKEEDKGNKGDYD